MRYTITGDNLQFVNVELSPDEMFYSSGGSMRYMTGNIVMESKATGGFMAGLKRKISGESFFQLQYRCEGGTGIVGLGGDAPGKILDLDMSQGPWLVQKTGYLGSEPGVELEMAFQKKLGSILFGGEGLILQRLSGNGKAFINACGDLIVVELKPGETYKVATGNVVAWQDCVRYDITAAGNIKTAIFGGQGLFVTSLTGPGKIVLQSMTLGELAMSLVPYLPTNNS